MKTQGGFRRTLKFLVESIKVRGGIQMESNVETKEKEIRLIINDGKRTLDNPTIKVRWCITKEMFESVKDSSLFILFAIHDGNKERRILSPVRQYEEYIALYKHGEYKINAFLISLSDELFKTHKRSREQTPEDYLERIYLAKTYDIYDTSLLNNRGDIILYECNNLYEIKCFCSEEVHIPEGVFAEKPNELLWKFVNFPYRKSPPEQCDFRKRLMFSPLITPLAALFHAGYFILSWIGKVILAIFAMSLLCFDLNWKNLGFSAHLRDKDIDSLSNCHSKSLISKTGRWEYWVITPIFWSFGFFVAWILVTHLPLPNSPFNAFLAQFSSLWEMFVFVMFTAWVFSICLVCAFDAAIKFFAIEKEHFDEIKMSSSRKRKMLEDEEVIKALSCSVNDVSTTQKRRTYLLFRDTKARVCRPYSN